MYDRDLPIPTQCKPHGLYDGRHSWIGVVYLCGLLLTDLSMCRGIRLPLCLLPAPSRYVRVCGVKVSSRKALGLLVHSTAHKFRFRWHSALTVRVLEIEYTINS